MARFNAPVGLAADGAGALYVADTLNEAIRKIELASGAVTTVAGVLGVPGSDDGPATAAHFTQPGALAIDGLGDLFVADALDYSVRRVDLAQRRRLDGDRHLVGQRRPARPAAGAARPADRAGAHARRAPARGLGERDPRRPLVTHAPVAARAHVLACRRAVRGLFSSLPGA